MHVKHVASRSVATALPLSTRGSDNRISVLSMQPYSDSRARGLYAAAGILKDLLAQTGFKLPTQTRPRHQCAPAREAVAGWKDDSELDSAIQQTTCRSPRPPCARFSVVPVCSARRRSRAASLSEPGILDIARSVTNNLKHDSLGGLIGALRVLRDVYERCCRLYR